MIPKQSILGFLSALFVVSPAHAAIVQYNNQMAWEDDAPANRIVENFDATPVDRIFRPGRVLAGSGPGASIPSRVRHFSNPNQASFSMGTFSALGYDWNYLNLLDIPPLEFCGPNPLVPMFINSEEPEVRPGTRVRLNFSTPMSAWGADFYFSRDSERLVVDLLGPADFLIATLTPAASTVFLGFVATAGEQIHAMVFRTEMLIVGPQGEAFCLDDAQGSPVTP